MLSCLLASDEFYARAQTLISSGTADERYVQALYQVLLSRSGSAASVQSARSGTALCRAQGVAQGFLNSAEFRADQVEGYYEALFNRPGDTAGIAGWVASGADLASILVAFESSPEFMRNG